MEVASKIQEAKQLMDDFAIRTGLDGAKGDPTLRYLWTDAFAVLAFFGMARILKEDSYSQMALRLIDLVHEHLGKFHPRDKRKGPISGLSEKEAKLDPTAAGLRIGKKLPERQKDQSYNSQLEWERDGQYFHYLSRWMIVLLQAYKETKDEKYIFYAKRLFLSTRKFIYGSGSALAMYWKMDTELSRPLVSSMGHHDPLEGLLCGLGIKNAILEEDPEMDELIKKFKFMCEGKSWATTDPLGIGGLLLNAVRSADLQVKGISLPSSVKPGKLFKECHDSLMGTAGLGKDENPNRRLAFRECGLSLGLQVTRGFKNDIFDTSSVEGLTQFFPLASELEDFWLNREHRQASTWKDHLDINSVTLAASLLASEVPGVFSGTV